MIDIYLKFNASCVHIFSFHVSTSRKVYVIFNGISPFTAPEVGKFLRQATLTEDSV